VLIGPRQVEIVDRPEPELLPGSCVVAIERCGIGGPDLVAWSTGRVPAPAWFGHEWSGRVVAVGEGSADRFVGERVVGAVSPPCGSCRPCLAGIGAMCHLTMAMIVGTDDRAGDHGAFADLIRVDSRRLHRLPEGVDFADGALAEPGAVAAHAVRRARPSLGDVVVVVGAGTVGLLVAELARLAGASRVAVVELEAERRELACDLGADAAFERPADVDRWLAGQGHGLGADIVFDCAGGQDALIAGLTSVRSGGLVVLVGFTADDASIPADLLLGREVTVMSSLGYTIADVHRALDLMADDRFRVSNLYDRTVGFAELPAVFEDMSRQRAQRPKVLFRPDSPR
jgi:(R,R)-butanediol dehydrogenase/meso-butanediol dehydrogenase/diacetyl reductase